MLCKSCKRKIDEHLCPFCGHNNDNKKNDFDIESYYSQQSCEDVDNDGVVSEINDDHPSKMNSEYQQQTNYNPNSGNKSPFTSSLGNATQKKTIDVDPDDFKPKQQTMNRPVAKTPFGNATEKKTITVTKTTHTSQTIAGQGTRTQTSNSQSQYNWDSSTHQWNNDVRTSHQSSVSDPQVSKIFILAILLLFGFGSFPIVGLIMMIILKKSCGDFLTANTDSHPSYGLIKVINVIAIIAIIFTIITYLTVVGGIFATIASEFM